MTKKHSTKRSLIASFLALCLCFTMLIGTTFAWFTDSVTSANNIIKSGTLDVEMHWAEGELDPNADDTAWTDASTGAIFNNDKWEPGYTEVRHIKIENEGTLALKYQLSIAANGDVSDLADVIDVYFVDPAVQVADRAALDGIEPIGTLTEVLAGMPGKASGDLLENETDTITLALKMRESAGNEYQNKAIGSDFVIQLLATQLTSESDSFGNQYDKDAAYDVIVNSISELSGALLMGGNIQIFPAITQWVLTEDVVISEGTMLNFDNDIEIITNGYKLELNNATFTVNAAITLDGTITVGAGDSVINGNGTIVRKSSKTMLNCQTEDSSLTISGVTLDGGVEITSSKTAIVMIRKGAEVNVINNAIVQNSKSSKDGSAAFNVGLGTLNLDGAVIRNNELTAAKGGAIYIRDGAVVNVRNTEVYGNTGKCGAFIGEDNYDGGCTVNIYSGANVHNNTSTDAGHSGVIYLRKTSVVNIYGGIFSDNSGVYSQDTGNATLNIMGGTFNGGSFAGNNSSSIINLSGNAQITANGTALVFANGNASGLTDDIVFITGALTDGANITLNAETIEHILSRTDGYIAKGSNYIITESDVAKFHCDGYTFKLDYVNNTIIVETN